MRPKKQRPLEDLIAELEDPRVVPGTSLTRLITDPAFLRSKGVRVSAGPNNVLAWVVGVGMLAEPKKYYYGLTLRDAVQKAHDAITAAKGSSSGSA